MEMEMKVSGYMLREAIKEQTLKSDTASSLFDDSLRAFPSEVKSKPQEVVDSFLEAEEAVAKLQTLQAEYNLKVFLTFEGATLTLTQAVKMVGGLARAEKMWRSAANPKKDRYSFSDNAERDPSKERSTPQVSQEDAALLSSRLARRAGRLRAAIATANAIEIEMDFDSALLS
jgi:hypothetical protein